MARLVRPLLQWPKLRQHCCHSAPLNYCLSSFLQRTPIATKETTSLSFSVTSAPSSQRNVHNRSRGLRPTNAPLSNSHEDDSATESDSDEKKSRNQKKREARRAVRWGMQIAAFSTPQIKRILRYASKSILILKLTLRLSANYNFKIQPLTLFLFLFFFFLFLP